jgi:hypothetical protein
MTAAFTFFLLPSPFFLPRAFHPPPVEECALGLLLARGGFDQTANEKGQTAGRRFFNCDRANLRSGGTKGSM